MRRSLRLAIYVPSLVITCWYGMMLVHESGHLLAATLTGVKVEQLEFPLLGFSRTDVPPNPHALAIVWGGPMFGAAAPLAAWLIVRLFKYKSHLLQVFAAFCLVANGLYIGVGSFARIGDAGDMLRTGSPIVFLWLFGALASGAGLLMLHRLGPKLGIDRMTTSDLAIAISSSFILVIFAIFF